MLPTVLKQSPKLVLVAIVGLATNHSSAILQILQMTWMQCNQRKVMEAESAVAIDGITSIADGLLIYFKLAISNTHPKL
jgi:hypothetical protein